jgi:hypothetical protein
MRFLISVSTFITAPGLLWHVLEVYVEKIPAGAENASCDRRIPDARCMACMYVRIKLGFPHAGVSGHNPKLVIGDLEGVRVAVFGGQRLLGAGAPVESTDPHAAGEDDDQVVAVARSTAASMAALDSVEVTVEAEESAVVESDEVVEQVATDGEEA